MFSLIRLRLRGRFLRVVTAPAFEQDQYHAEHNRVIGEVAHIGDYAGNCVVDEVDHRAMLKAIQRVAERPTAHQPRRIAGDARALSGMRG